MISLRRLTHSTAISRGLHGKRAMWSHAISFSSPDSDFTSQASNKQPPTNEKVESDENKWSNLLSFSAPESDFTASEIHYDKESNADVLQADFINHIQNSKYHRESMAYSLSFAGTESDVCSSNFENLLNERMKRQLEYATERSQSLREDFKLDRTTTVNENDDLHVTNVASDTPLPLTYASATKPDDPRAIVVTEASNPFRIVSVNTAWEELCGFSAAECHGKTLKCLQGPETDNEAVATLMTQLKRGEEAGTVLTNYSKSGRKFQNLLRVGPLKSDHGEVTHVVGVLTELIENAHQTSNGAQKINA